MSPGVSPYLGTPLHTKHRRRLAHVSDMSGCDIPTTGGYCLVCGPCAADCGTTQVFPSSPGPAPSPSLPRVRARWPEKSPIACVRVALPKHDGPSSAAVNAWSTIGNRPGDRSALICFVTSAGFFRGRAESFKPDQAPHPAPRRADRPMFCDVPQRLPIMVPPRSMRSSDSAAAAAGDAPLMM